MLCIRPEHGLERVLGSVDILLEDPETACFLGLSHRAIDGLLEPGDDGLHARLAALEPHAVGTLCRLGRPATSDRGPHRSHDRVSVGNSLGLLRRATRKPAREGHATGQQEVFDAFAVEVPGFAGGRAAFAAWYASFARCCATGRVARRAFAVRVAGGATCRARRSKDSPALTRARANLTGRAAGVSRESPINQSVQMTTG